MEFEPLTKEEVCKVIEGKGVPGRVPVMVHFWSRPNAYGDRAQLVRDIEARYPCDCQFMVFRTPIAFVAPEDAPHYRWTNFDNPYSENTPIDERIAINDWDQLDAILADWPDTEYAGMFPENPLPDGRYRLGYWWFCLFERLWSLRGMTNSLIDFYEYPDNVHRLFRALTDFYKRMIERAKTELQIDGVFYSDDLGTQENTFFSPEIFDEFFAPYYREIIGKCHELGIHCWQHTCGNIKQFIPKFIELGLDVIHPIQKYTMDEKEIAEAFGDKICIWAGFDVQQIIPFGTPDEVRQEVRFMIDTYYRSEGRFMLTAGNGITPDTTLESFEALLDESLRYGSKKVNG